MSGNWKHKRISEVLKAIGADACEFTQRSLNRLLLRHVWSLQNEVLFAGSFGGVCQEAWRNISFSCICL